jgi:hypothetical protein
MGSDCEYWTLYSLVKTVTKLWLPEKEEYSLSDYQFLKQNTDTWT